MESRTYRVVRVVALALVLTAVTLWSQDDRPERIRALAGTGKLGEALELSEQWMAGKPGDIDAATWHARIVGWQGRTREAEYELRLLLKEDPGSPEILTALAGVLNARGSYEAALAALEQACPDPAAAPECGIARARTLSLLGRTIEARRMLQSLSHVGAVAADSRRELARLAEETRRTVRVAAGTEQSAHTSDGLRVSTALVERWTTSIETEVEATQYRRFGAVATGGQARLTWKFGARSSVTASAGGFGNQAIAPRLFTGIGFDHGSRISQEGPVRAVEAIFEQRWTWYRGTRLIAFAPGAMVYLPREWDLLLSTNTTELAMGRDKSWKISGLARLSIPVARRLRANLLASTGSENFGTVEQLQFRASRSFGGGVSIRLRTGSEFRMALRRQSIASGLAVMSYEGGYAVRF